MKGSLISYDAIHEAAHAVVAAHLRVPFRYVTIHPRRVDGGWEDGHLQIAHRLRIRLYISDGRGGFRPRTGEEAQATRERYITNVAVVALGARAFCVSSHISFKQVNGKTFVPDGFDGDEKLVSKFAKELGIKNVRIWRRGLLQRAREIVARSDIRLAIREVALELEISKNIGNGRVGGKVVRDVLRTYRRLALAGKLRELNLE